MGAKMERGHVDAQYCVKAGLWRGGLQLKRHGTWHMDDSRCTAVPYLPTAQHMSVGIVHMEEVVPQRRRR